MNREEARAWHLSLTSSEDGDGGLWMVGRDISLARFTKMISF